MLSFKAILIPEDSVNASWNQTLSASVFVHPWTIMIADAAVKLTRSERCSL